MLVTSNCKARDSLGVKLDLVPSPHLGGRGRRGTKQHECECTFKGPTVRPTIEQIVGTGLFVSALVPFAHVDFSIFLLLLFFAMSQSNSQSPFKAITKVHGFISDFLRTQPSPQNRRLLVLRVRRFSKQCENARRAMMDLRRRHR